MHTQYTMPPDTCLEMPGDLTYRTYGLRHLEEVQGCGRRRPFPRELRMQQLHVNSQATPATYMYT